MSSVDSGAGPAPVDPATTRALTAWLRQTQVDYRQPSLTAAIARDGQLVWSDSVGSADGRGAWPATHDTAYRIASVTKTFVAVAVLQLVEAGQVDLDDPAGRHVPDAPVADATVSQLLSHTSGLQAETDGDWWERSPGYSWDALVAMGAQRRFRAGRKYHYSNLGYAVLGRIVETLEGQPWDVAIGRKVLAPLGLGGTARIAPQGAATGWGVHPHAALLHHEPVPDYLAMGPAGELWSTARDLAVWGSFLAGRTPGPLSSELLAQMREPWTINDLPGQPWVGGHGLGLQLWNVDGARHAGHTGSVPGFTCEVRADLGTGDVVVTLGSATTGFMGGLGLLEVFQQRMPALAQPWVADPTQAAVLDLLGTWYWGTTAYEISADVDGGLVATVPAIGRSGALLPDGPDRWVGLTGYFAGEPLVVGRDGVGRAAWLDVASFRLTRTPYAADGNVPGGLDERGWH